MSEPTVRVERDSLGDIEVPGDALYGAQTQRAVNNFRIGGWRFPRPFLRALALVKRCAADANVACGVLDADLGAVIAAAAAEVERGVHDDQFPVDVFQTGSGTSVNMNANEVIAHLASRAVGRTVHPNDHVNRSQSSNDVIPTTIHLSAYTEAVETLLPALAELRAVIDRRARALDEVIVIGRTHLMDAMPIRLSQELGGWSHQIARAEEAVRATLVRLAEVPLGGTAVGTGVNAPPAFGREAARRIAESTGHPFVTSRNAFASMSAMDTAVELSGQLKVMAGVLLKIANDLRWMNSGPQAGLQEIALPVLQPGSSIMPGKVNPVVPEAVAMVCARVVGNDTTITMAGQSGNFQLNVMLPIIAHTLLESLHLLANAALALGERAIAGFTVDPEALAARIENHPVLATALTPLVGYDMGARIAQRAQLERRPVKEVAAELTGLSREDLERRLDLRQLTGDVPSDR